MIEKILSLDGVKDYTVDLTHPGWTDLTLRPGCYAATEPDPDPNEFIPCTEEFLMLWRHAVNIYTCRNGEAHKNFRMGALTIKDGRNIVVSDRLKVVISDWLAEENHLSVGDAITLETKEGSYGFSNEPMKALGNPVEVEIAGLFHANFSQTASNAGRKLVRIGCGSGFGYFIIGPIDRHMCRRCRKPDFTQGRYRSIPCQHFSI